MHAGILNDVVSVLLIGDVNDKANTADWKLTLGDNSDPNSNAQILSSSVWAREIKIDAWGQFVAIIRSTA